MDILDCCDICGEDHSTELCPELGLDVRQFEFDQLSTRARLTLPRVFQVVDEGNGLVGVVAKETIPSKTQFGPYEAKRTTHIFDDAGFFTLKLICKDGATVCLDTTDENECNWMCLVRAAESDSSKNCMAYQLGSNIFYNTTREINKGEELQVWYAPIFARKLGKPSEPDGETRILLGHRIEPIMTEMLGEPDTVAAAQTEGQKTDTSPHQTADLIQVTRGEIKKAFYCPRCGNTFDTQTKMVQHLREHVLAITQKDVGPGGKRGRGRPRIHPVKVSDSPKRGRGRPKKCFIASLGTTAKSTPDASDKPGQGRKRKKDEEMDGEEEEYFNLEEESDEEEDMVQEKRLRIDVLDNDMDEDYSPMKELSTAGRRVQPRRVRKGQNSRLSEDYVVSKIGQKLNVENGNAVEEVEKASDNDATPMDDGKVFKDGGVKTVKRGRGRPKKVKEFAEPQLVVIEIVNGENESKELDKTAGINEEKLKQAEENETEMDIGDDTMAKETAMDIVDDAMVKENGMDIVDDAMVKENKTEVSVERAEVVGVDGENDYDEKQDKTSETSLNDKLVGNDIESSLEAPADDSSKVETDPDEKMKGDVVVMFEETGDDMYGCVLCGEKFKQEIDAISHFMSHSRGSDKFKEGSTFKTSTDQASEQTEEDPCDNGEGIDDKKQQRYPCDICQQAFRSAQYLYRHMVMHTDVFSCIRCKKTFSRKDSMQKHVLKCCPQYAEYYNIYSCDLCSRVFSTATGRKKHLKKCKSVQCEECKKVFGSPQDLETHTCRKDEAEDSTSGKYSCGICPKSFQSLYYLKQHTLLHEKLHSCDRCGKSLPSQDDLEEHKALCQTLEAIKTLGTGKCEKCDQEFNNARIFREHYLSHSHPYQCDKCYRRFVKIGTLSSHDCQNMSEEFLCKICGKSFKNQMNIDRHTKEHGCMKYECSGCNEQFHMKSHAKNHTCDGKFNPEAKIIYTSDTKEICHACGKSFSTKSNLTKHMLLHGEKNLACPHCEKRFHLDVYLKDHITCVHYNIYKYQCTQCGKMLKSKTGLIAHTKLYHSTNVEAHPCPKCGKIFKQRGNLKTHMFSHSTEKKFACAHCDKAFKYPDQLSRHRLEHKTVNKLGCPHCDKMFYREYEVKKHLQIYHSGYIYVCGLCSSRCGHRHTLVRHYKRKHAEDFHLLSQEGYLDGLLKHINEIYPGAPSMETEGITLQTTVSGDDTQQGQEMTQAAEMLSRDAAEALHSLAMGTVTAKQYQILKDKGLFQENLQLQTGGQIQQVAMMPEQSIVVSEEGNVIQHQEVLQQEQLITADTSNIATATVAMEGTIGLLHNKGGTISIEGLQGITQTLEGTENTEGHIVILQIVDPGTQEASGEYVHGEIIHQFQEGEIIQGSIVDNSEEVLHDGMQSEEANLLSDKMESDENGLQGETSDIQHLDDQTGQSGEIIQRNILEIHQMTEENVQRDVTTDMKSMDNQLIQQSVVMNVQQAGEQDLQQGEEKEIHQVEQGSGVQQREIMSMPTIVQDDLL